MNKKIIHIVILLFLSFYSRSCLSVGSNTFLSTGILSHHSLQEKIKTSNDKYEMDPMVLLKMEVEEPLKKIEDYLGFGNLGLFTIKNKNAKVDTLVEIDPLKDKNTAIIVEETGKKNATEIVINKEENIIDASKVNNRIPAAEIINEDGHLQLEKENQLISPAKDRALKIEDGQSLEKSIINLKSSKGNFENTKGLKVFPAIRISHNHYALTSMRL